jgi:hypothetical protein
MYEVKYAGTTHVNDSLNEWGFLVEQILTCIVLMGSIFGSERMRSQGLRWETGEAEESRTEVGEVC